MTFFDKVEIGFTGFEKHFYLPALAIDANNFVLRKLWIGADESYPIFSVAFIPNTDDSGRYLGGTFSDHDIYGNKIPATATTFRATVEDLL